MVTPLHPSEPDDTEPPRTPRAIAWMDGRVLPADQATMPLADDGVLRGDAVTVTMLVRAGRTHARDQRLARLRASAREMGIRVPVVTRPVEDLLLAWGEHDGALTVVVTRSGLVRALLRPASPPASLALAAVTAPWRSPLTGVSTLGHAAGRWATRRARDEEADDALVVDPDGHVCELPEAAVVAVVDGRLETPDPDVVPVTWSHAVEMLRAVAEVTAATLTLEQVRKADELWAVSARWPLVPVHGLDDVPYPAPGPVAEQLLPQLDEHLAATLD